MSPGRQLDEPVDELHRRRLAAAGRADEAADLARRDRHREVVDRRSCAAGVPLGRVVEDDLDRLTPASAVDLIAKPVRPAGHALVAQRVADVAYIPGEAGRERRPADRLRDGDLGRAALRAQRDGLEGRAPVRDLVARADAGARDRRVPRLRARAGADAAREPAADPPRAAVPDRLRDRGRRARAVALLRLDRAAADRDRAPDRVHRADPDRALGVVGLQGADPPPDLARARARGRRARGRGGGLERADARRPRRGCRAVGRRRVRGLRADGRARGQVARPRLADRVRLPLRRALLGARPAALALSRRDGWTTASRCSATSSASRCRSGC